MNDVLEFAGTALTWAGKHRQGVVLAGLGLTVVLLFLAYMVRRAVTSGRLDKWLSIAAMLLGFGWSAEAMWEIATQRLHLSAGFAVFVFAVFEVQLGVAMMRAERHQRDHNHPGRYGRTAWLIAVVMGGVAAMAGDSPVENALRLAVPLLVTLQWWDGLTADGTEKRPDAITWTWTPRRILVAIGLAKPGEQDLQTVDQERQTAAIAKVSHRLHSTRSGLRRSWCQMRLRRLSMAATDEMLTAARERVERVWQAADRTRPIKASDHTLVAIARAEAEAARTEAAEARKAEAEAVAHAEVVAGHAEAEAACRAMAEAEATAARKEAEAEAARHKEAEAEATAARKEAEAEAARHKEAEVEATAARAEAEAEAARRAEAEATAKAAKAEANAEAVRASRVGGQAEAEAANWQQRVRAAENAAVQAGAALDQEQQRRYQAEAQAQAAGQLLDEERQRLTAAHDEVVREVEQLRQRLAEAEAEAEGPRRPRPRRAPAAPTEPVTFDGAPVPQVDGVGAATVLKVLKARKLHPTDTQKALAERVEVSDRTVRAVLTAASEDRTPALAATG